MRFVFNTSLSDEVKEFINAGAGSYPISGGTFHVNKYGGKTYIAYEVDGRATWHVVVNATGQPIESITQ
jgi:hypothetical protein